MRYDGMITRARKRHPAEFLPLIFKGLFFVVFLGILFWGAHQLKTTRFFPIHHVKILGAKETNHEAIQQILMPLVNKSFFALDVDMIKDRLLKDPWVSTVVVRRIWPDQIWVTLQEKIPFARWNDTNVLSTKGDLFLPNSPEKYHLPNLYGPSGQHLLIMQYHQKMQTVFDALHQRIAR